LGNKIQFIRVGNLSVNLEGKSERENPKRTIFVSGGLDHYK